MADISMLSILQMLKDDFYRLEGEMRNYQYERQNGAGVPRPLAGKVAQDLHIVF